MRLKKQEKGINIIVVDRNVKPHKSKAITVYETSVDEMVKAIQKMIEANAT